ncbi:RNA polymerase sigma factor [Fulvivirga sedimenti]|uniref:Sigma-70 family RNA polymerase sigma factor n=1 Tax=Fulvivirga sedimenti TaxID=2879465 RepID=A0A9X1HR02_9BACT|nr:sigma-70 family RNA polymerase sigma factor [Fulvivirga sedimenti]MCA6075527.1 sigma-70 family RNA polymerase sigma factor [Fulvivirga sedimenti]MCA6076704.1 sigma-70 family RNA polymerase sigma factor [Fulvivirga sedimenti]MCA6077832.1 sigma-70 family RNA polymerase sigma factor [Fulvivirga sedimenti]
MSNNQQLDHLFRHQYGKMVSLLAKIFGLEHLDTIEDAVQDTFITAFRSWPNQYPDNPEGWLYKAAKNRMLDILRKRASEQKRFPKVIPDFENQSETDLILENEVSDSQLRMIFTACNPRLDTRDQLAFSLKTISGFSEKEIASALLLKQETVKKRLQRARKTIQAEQIAFEIPEGSSLPHRLDRVHDVIYLIFNEGFHSGKKELLIREELCGEALRLSKMLLTNSYTSTAASHALFALLCFHSARLRSKTNADHEVISLREQDRTAWYRPLIELGHSAMNKAVETEELSRFHYEAAIASEHLKAPTYEETDWSRLLMWYERLDAVYSSPLNHLNMAIIHIQLEQFTEAMNILQKIEPEELEQRRYLYHGLLAEYYFRQGIYEKARSQIDIAIEKVNNNSEKNFLTKKRDKILAAIQQA